MQSRPSFALPTPVTAAFQTRASRPAVVVVLAYLMTACAQPVPGLKQLTTSEQQKLHPLTNGTLPISLRAQSPEILQDTLTAVGDEVWECRRSGKSFAWTSTGSEATLVDLARQSVGTVTPNHMFVAYDGSYVIGRVTGAEIVATNALPWQRLTARFGAGPGRFSKTTLVQRVQTSGGLPPNPKCIQEGITLYVPYSATYLFYGTASLTGTASTETTAGDMASVTK